MEFIKNLFRSGQDKLVLKYNKEDRNWSVQKSGSILYLGTKEQCNKYMEHHQFSSLA
ncbi:MAG: hypothetical protein WBA74_01600 [Cyclobacteriaceae bacterium]